MNCARCGHDEDEHGYRNHRGRHVEDCSMPGCYCEGFVAPAEKEEPSE